MAFDNKSIRPILENEELSIKDKVNQLQALHHEIVNGLMDEKDEAIQRAEKAEKAAESAKAEKEAAEKALTDYKDQQTQKDTHAAKEAKFRELLKTAGVLDKYADRVVRLSGEDIDKVMRTTLINKDGHYLINRKYVGRDAAVILRDAGVRFTGDPRLVIAEVDRNHPFVTIEMLMPVLAIVRVRDIDEAIEEAFRAERGCKHSAMIHSSNVHNMSKAARKLNTTIFVKNSSSFSGLGFDGEGYTTMTIATPTGEGVTSARSFTRLRRCVLYGDFRIC